MNKNNIEIDQNILNKILTEGKYPAGMMSLYLFYSYKKLQQTEPQISCSTEQSAYELKTTLSKIRQYKKELMRIGIIKNIIIRDEKKRVQKHVISL